MTSMPKSRIFAIGYLSCIPFFSFIYWFLPINSFKTELDTGNFITCLYFSTVTITTVGFGDISPLSLWAQILVIFESVSGLFLIGFYLNALAQSQSIRLTTQANQEAAEKSYQLRRAQLLRFDKLINIAIEQYDWYVFALTTPLDKRQTDDPKSNPGFNFSDMADLFGPTLYATDFLTPSVELYFKYQNKLVSNVRDMVRFVELSDWPALEQQSLKFLSDCLSTDIEDAIINILQNKQSKDIITKMIADTKGEPVYRGSGNLIDVYIGLYELIKDNLNFIQIYNEQLSTIRAVD
jgi:hypothetical protein